MDEDTRPAQEWMSLPQAAARLGLQHVSVWKAVQRGTLEATRMGKYFFTTPAAVEHYRQHHAGRPGRRPATLDSTER